MSNGSGGGIPNDGGRGEGAGGGGGGVVDTHWQPLNTFQKPLKVLEAV